MKSNPMSARSKRFHDINNTLGALWMNLEVANDSALCEGTALESVQDATNEVKKLKAQIGDLRLSLDESKGD